ncbi:RNA-binding protein 41, partial [Elysia marginata]
MLDELEGKTRGEREPRRERRRRRKLEKKMQYYKQFEKDDASTKEERQICKFSIDKRTDSDAELADDSDVSRLSGGDKEVGPKECTQHLSEKTVSNNENEEQDSVLPYEEDGQEVGEATCAPRPADWVSPKPEKRKRKKPQQPTAEEVEMRLDIEVLSKNDIAKNKMSLEEIKKMPKFENYTPGNPNRVLYVKNLPSSTTDTDLMSLFGCLQQHDGQPRISIKLLSGRMKGQAFVTLP